MLKVLYITGYKNYELGIFSNNCDEVNFIKQAIAKRLIPLIEEGLEWVIITGQLGIELWAGEVVLELKNEYTDLKLAVLTPFLHQESNWSEKNKEYYNSVLSSADLLESISKKPYISPAQFKNRDSFILHKTDGILIVYDEEKEGSAKYIWQETKKYQENNAYLRLQIDFNDLQQLIEEAALEHANE